MPSGRSQHHHRHGSAHFCPRCRRPGHTSRECCSKLLQTVLRLDGPADLFNVEGVYTNDARTAQERRPLRVALPAVWVNYDVTATVLGFLSWRDVLASVGHVNLEMKGCIAPLASCFVDAKGDVSAGTDLRYEQPVAARCFSGGGMVLPVNPIHGMRFEMEFVKNMRADADDAAATADDAAAEHTAAASKTRGEHHHVDATVSPVPVEDDDVSAAVADHGSHALCDAAESNHSRDVTPAVCPTAAASHAGTESVAGDVSVPCLPSSAASDFGTVSGAASSVGRRRPRRFAVHRVMRRIPSRMVVTHDDQALLVGTGVSQFTVVYMGTVVTLVRVVDRTRTPTTLQWHIIAFRDAAGTALRQRMLDCITAGAIGVQTVSSFMHALMK